MPKKVIRNFRNDPNIEPIKDAIRLGDSDALHDALYNKELYTHPDYLLYIQDAIYMASHFNITPTARTAIVKKLYEHIRHRDLYQNGEWVDEKSGFTALMAATDTNNERFVKKLIEKGADVNHSTTVGITATSIAIKKLYIKVLNLLYTNGATIETDSCCFRQIQKHANDRSLHTQLQWQALLEKVTPKPSPWQTISSPSSSLSDDKEFPKLGWQPPTLQNDEKDTPLQQVQYKKPSRQISPRKIIQSLSEASTETLSFTDLINKERSNASKTSSTEETLTI